MQAKKCKPFSPNHGGFASKMMAKLSAQFALSDLFIDIIKTFLFCFLQKNF